MAASIADELDRLTQSQLDTITYVAGFDADLQMAAASFNADFGLPAVTAQAVLQQGATITFSFDPGAGFTAEEQDNAVQSLAVWSGMCNLNFVYTTQDEWATVVFAKAGTSYAGYSLPPGTYEAPLYGFPTGTPNLYQLAQALIVLDTSGDYGDFTSYTRDAGYGISALVHEVGHLVGLGHSGPYDGAVDPAVEQNNSTDVRSWSIMSYIRPSDTDAKYYADYDPAGIDFGYGEGDVYRAPYTPMGLDIFAAQRLYGGPTNPMFGGDKTYGFNSNITYTALDGSQRLLGMYDFTVDVNPVVTLFSTGTGNTFDISGFAEDATVDLRDGRFSSVAGMTGNIFIEYGTRIDALAGGRGADTVVANDDGDTINGGAGADTVLGGAGGDSILGGAGADSLAGGGGNDMLNGGNGADTMAGGDGDDTYVVGSADDSIVELSGGGLDTVHAAISFVLPAEVERLVLSGAAAIDGTGNALDNRLQGNAGANLLQGGGGNDTLLGGDGNDTLLGGVGNDILTGSAGADSFRFLDAADGRDRIADFVPGLDVIEISALGFGGGLVDGMGLAAADRFVVGAKATAAHGQFIYNQGNGMLSWDADGIGAGGRVQVALLAGAPVLTATDVHVLL